MPTNSIFSNRAVPPFSLAADLCQYLQLERHSSVGYPFVQSLEGIHAPSAVIGTNKHSWITVNRELSRMLRSECLRGSDAAYPLDGQPEMIGNLVVDPVRIPPVQNELLDDLVLDIFQVVGHNIWNTRKNTGFKVVD